jgi:hypothetical protein
MSEGSRGYILYTCTFKSRCGIYTCKFKSRCGIYTCTFKSRCGKIGKSIPQKAQRKHMH